MGNRCKCYNSILIFLIFWIFFSSLNAESIFEFNWKWGIEHLQNSPYFNFTFSPSFIYKKNLKLKLYLPVLINSNGTILKRDWDSKYDVLTKINFCQFSNNLLDIGIKSINNILLGNKSLVYDYSANIYEPILIKKGLYANINLKNICSTFIVDDLNDNDIFFIDANFKYKVLKTGITYVYDNDVLDECKEEPVDKNVTFDALNIYQKIHIFKKYNLGIYFFNDFIKILKTRGYTVDCGLSFGWKNFIFFAPKINYFSKRSYPTVIFNKFYEINRRYIYQNFTTNYQVNFSFFFLWELKETLKLSLNIENMYKDEPDFILKIQNLRNFFGKVNFTLEFYNKNIKKWYEAFSEKKENTFINFKSFVPFSKNVFLHFDYTKSFIFDNNILNEFRDSIVYVEFIF